MWQNRHDDDRGEREREKESERERQALIRQGENGAQVHIGGRNSRLNVVILSFLVKTSLLCFIFKITLKMVFSSSRSVVSTACGFSSSVFYFLLLIFLHFYGFFWFFFVFFNHELFLIFEKLFCYIQN